MRILIGTPLKDTAPDDYIKSLVDMVLYTQAAGHEVEYVIEHGSLYDSRDRICRRAMRDHFDYMLQIDNDMTFPPDALCRMMERDVDVCTGVYVGREPAHKPVLFTILHKDDETCGPYARKKGLRELMKKDLFEVAGCGAGFLLVKEHILRIMMIHKHEWFKTYAGLGEDVSFCQRCTELGIKIYADNSFPMGHIKTTQYYQDDWSGIEDEDVEDKLEGCE